MIDWNKSAELNAMPIDELKAYFRRYPQSNKYVVDSCDECHNDHKVVFNKAPILCKSCAIKPPRSDEYRKNISLAKLGEKNGMFGKKAPRSDEARQHISAGHQGVAYNEWTGFSEGDWREWDKAVYLNEPFPGCHRHHLTKTIVACIPDELHRHIPHNMRTAQGMAEMNMLSLQFIHGCYDD